MDYPTDANRGPRQQTNPGTSPGQNPAVAAGPGPGRYGAHIEAAIQDGRDRLRAVPGLSPDTVNVLLQVVMGLIEAYMSRHQAGPNPNVNPDPNAGPPPQTNPRA